MSNPNLAARLGRELFGAGKTFFMRKGVHTTSMTSPERYSRFTLPLRRFAAFLLDYLVIIMYAGALFGVMLLITDSEVAIEGSSVSKLRGHALAFTTLAFPVWLYFSLFESSRFQATLGKLLVRIKVVNQSEQGICFLNAGLRNAIKFLPWEIAHTAIWYVPDRPFLDPMPTGNIIVCIVAQLLVVVLAMSMFMGTGRAIHDRIAGTDVVTG